MDQKGGGGGGGVGVNFQYILLNEARCASFKCRREAFVKRLFLGVLSTYLRKEDPC